MGRYNTSHIAVRVIGDKGSCRFSGFSWGYDGEGSRSLKELFKALKVDNTIYNWVIEKEWPNFNGENKTFWRINIIE